MGLKSEVHNQEWVIMARVRHAKSVDVKIVNNPKLRVSSLVQNKLFGVTQAEIVFLSDRVIGQFLKVVSTTVIYCTAFQTESERNSQLMLCCNSGGRPSFRVLAGLPGANGVTLANEMFGLSMIENLGSSLIIIIKNPGARHIGF